MHQKSFDGKHGLVVVNCLTMFIVHWTSEMFRIFRGHAQITEKPIENKMLADACVENLSKYVCFRKIVSEKYGQPYLYLQSCLY